MKRVGLVSDWWLAAFLLLPPGGVWVWIDWLAPRLPLWLAVLVSLLSGAVWLKVFLDSPTYGGRHRMGSSPGGLGQAGTPK